MSAAKSIDIKKSVVDTVLAGLISLIVFGPIVGVVLDGYSFNLEPARVAVLVAIVMAGRFALSLFLQTPKGLKILQGFESSGSGVHVLPPDYKSRLRWIIPALIVIAIVFPIFANKYLLTVVILGLIYVLLGLGLNIVVGLAGLLDLGYVAFYAIGAYGLALGYQYLGLGFWTVLPLAAICAAAGEHQFPAGFGKTAGTGFAKTGGRASNKQRIGHGVLLAGLRGKKSASRMPGCRAGGN